MASLPNPIKIATKGIELGVQVGSFVAGQAFQRVQSLMDGDSKDETRYAPTSQPQRQEPAPRLESVKAEGETSTGSKPTTSSTTATGPGGTARMAPKAPARKPAARKAAPATAAAPQKEITAKPATRGTKGETDTTIKAAPRTGARSAGGRITNPKAAAKARKRNAGASAKTGAGAGTGQSAGAPTAAARTGDLSKAKGKGGRPATVKAENSPAELAASKTGRQAAPMGGGDDAS